MTKASERVCPVEQLEQLNRPSSDDVRYDPDAWSDVLTELDASEALAKRASASTQFVRDALTGIAAIEQEDRELVGEALDVQQMNDDRPTRRVRNRALSALSVLPQTSAALLCGWVSRVEVYERSYYTEHVRDAVGYYDPEDHAIQIGSDSSDPSHNWARSNEWRDEPEFSTTIHELGHAVHSMNGISVQRPDVQDNRESETPTLEPVAGIQRTEWQDAFFWDVVTAYWNAWGGRYDTLRHSSYQLATLEECAAIGFEGWVTAPSTLFEEQPLLWRAFERLP